jgi:hypothetical protein
MTPEIAGLAGRDAAAIRSCRADLHPEGHPMSDRTSPPHTRTRTRALLPLLASTLLLLCAGGAAAQTERILLVGDSWVDQAWSAGAFDTALAN